VGKWVGWVRAWAEPATHVGCQGLPLRGDLCYENKALWRRTKKQPSRQYSLTECSGWLEWRSHRLPTSNILKQTWCLSVRWWWSSSLGVRGLGLAS
jgi:hypothetical protein